MRQIFAPYWEWEDFKNGMYETPLKQDEQIHINNAVILLSDTKMFLSVCKLVLLHWKTAASVNLTNPSCNRRAWIGQLACLLSRLLLIIYFRPLRVF